MPELLRSLTDVSAALAGDQHGGKRKRRGRRGAKNADRIRRIPIRSDWKGFVEEGREAQCSPSNPFEPLHVGRSAIPKAAPVSFHTIGAVERLR